MSCELQSNPGDSIPDGALASGFTASWFSKDVRGARGLFVIEESGEVLGIARSASPRAIVVMRDVNNDGTADGVTVLAEEPTLTHGLAVHGQYIYASSDTTVFRWPYQPGSGGKISNNLKVVVVKNMNADGAGGAPMGHKTRTLVFDNVGRLYVSVGSAGNVDSDSYRSRIRRFNISNFPVGGIDFVSSGELFADGLRNEVGLAFDLQWRLWGVENGADNLIRNDLGGDIHNDNPAEELNLFDKQIGSHYGYPFCFTEYSLPKTVSEGGRGTVWAWPSFMNDGTHDDSWCRSNTIPPVVSMQAHSAPLGIVFYNSSKYVDPSCSANGLQPFPASMDGDAFIAFHGSWNRQPSTGYKVVRVPMDDGNSAGKEPIDFFCHKGSEANWPSGIRPVDVKFDKCNRLLVSSDGTSGRGDGIILISYSGSSKSPGDCQSCGDGKFNFLFLLIPLFFVVVFGAVAAWARKKNKLQWSCCRSNKSKTASVEDKNAERSV